LVSPCVVAGDSRSKDGVASARLCPAIHALVSVQKVRGMPATDAGMTT
jgi:hypothetical protein